jgi:hypothetical protein
VSCPSTSLVTLDVSRPKSLCGARARLLGGARRRNRLVVGALLRRRQSHLLERQVCTTHRSVPRAVLWPRIGVTPVDRPSALGQDVSGQRIRG